LLELLVALAILAMISIVIYSAFSTMRKTKEGLERVEDRYREGRMAMARITRDLSSAYLSAHQPIDPRLSVQKTAFIGRRDTPTDRVDFNCFCNQRRDRDAHESDQAEISYFGSEDPDRSGTIDLARRSSVRPDLDPRHGGTIEVLATDIDLFQLEYLDPQTALYNETWDSTQVTGQPNRLPLNVRVTLILNSGKRSNADGGRGRIRLVSVIAIPIQQPLSFAAL
jgi:general secretion pathway protein J